MTTKHVIGYVLSGAVLVYALFSDHIRRWRQRMRDARAIKNHHPLEHAVIVRLTYADLPPELQERHDVSGLQDQLREAIKKHGVGEFDGNEFGPDDVVLFMYGPDAERLFGVVEPILRASPLCKDAVAVIRRGPPGSIEREVSLA